MTDRHFTANVRAGFSVLLSIGAVCWSAVGRAGEKAPNATVPLKTVVLFNSGVGYFEHRAEVEGDAEVQLKFTADDINDLLKSMVVQDLGGGTISAVNYGSQAPISKVLKTFAIDLTDNPSLGDLLRQLRGEPLRLETPQLVEGAIVSVEIRKIKIDDEVFEREYLNLRTQRGLKSIALETISSIEIVDKELDGEFHQALEVLATAHDSDETTVTLRFSGEDKRPVRIGYIRETPVWKMTYRLVVQEDEPTLLQGWAIVENVTEDDWNGVNLLLVSGQPISYIMPLADPLYTNRPVVELELYSSLRPPKYQQDLQASEKLAELAAASPAPARLRKAAEQESAQNFAGRAADVLEDKKSDLRESLQQSVQAQAKAGAVGELFQYAIRSPVHLPRHESSMLPVVNEDVQSEKLSIYDQSVDAKHPLNGLRITNSTDLFLMEGPLTVYEGGTYAGDAVLTNLAAGADRLISYAVDLEVEVAPEAKSHPQNLVSVRLAKGTLYASYEQTREQSYTVKNTGQSDRTVLIQYPFDPNWNLVTPEEPAEKSRDSYRFIVEVDPNQAEKLLVKEQRTIRQQVALSNLDSNTIITYRSSSAISEEVKQALAEIVRRQHEIQTLQQQRQQAQQELDAIAQEQDRIRKNLAQIERNTDLYNRYIKKLTEQEDQIEKLRARLQDLDGQITAKRKSLDDYLLDLDVQ